MSYEFDDEVKTVSDYNGNYFGYGVHKVHIGQVTNDETESGSEFIEFTLLGDNDEEDTARVWFTSPKSANYSFNVLRSIFVHNQSDDKKEKARDAVDAVTNAKELCDLLQNVVGGECWFTKYESPDRTYVNKDGITKRSIDKNIMGYEPQPKPELIRQDSQKAELNALEGATDITGDKDVKIPGDKDWAK